MCLPVRFLPLNATCQASLGPALVSGTRPIPNCTAPVDQAFKKGVRSRVNTAFLASYFATALVLQSMLGGACPEPWVPSATGFVARQALMCAVSGATVPDWLSVAMGSVIVPL